MIPSRRAPWAVAALILAVYAASNIVWLRQNGLRCVSSDFHVRHFARAVEIYKLMEKRTPLMDIYAVLHKDTMQPAPLHSIAAAAALLALGKKIPLVTGLLNFAAFAAALVFLILLVQEMGRPPSEAAWTVALFALYPAIYGLSRLYGAFDFSVAAIMPAAVWCLLKTKSFDSRRWCLILAAVAAAAMLIKDTFAGYFAPLFLYAVYESCRGADARRRHINVLLVLGGGRC